MRRFRRFAAACAVLLLLMPSVCAVQERSGAYETYNYSYEDNRELAAAAAYVPVRIVRAESMGLSAFGTLSDLFVDAQHNEIYLADADNNRIVKTDMDFTAAQVFTSAGGKDFASPQGLFVSGDAVYVADTGNRRVVKLSRSGQTLAVYGKPDSPQFAQGVDFKPQKVVVTDQGEISMVCEGIYEGLVTIDQSGAFQGYSGTIPVRPSLWDLFWRVFSTREQLKSMASFLPVTYINVDLDESGFIYATSQAEQSKMANSVQRLNPGGNDVLINNSGQKLVGDLGNLYNGRSVGASVLGDVCCLPGGLFACVDQRRSKIYLYDSEGEMLFAFGGAGSQDGNLTVPSAIDSDGFTLYLADSSAGQITVFQPTAYGRCLIQGILDYGMGEYESSRKNFTEAFRYNTNSELAYLGIGKAQMREGQYHDAMLSFRLAANRTYYSRALEQYRREVFDEYFTVIFAVIAVLLLLAVAIPVVRKIRRRRGATPRTRREWQPRSRLAAGTDRVMKSVDFAFFCMTHPFKGFYELKAEKEGTMTGASILLALYVVSSMLASTLSGYLFGGSVKQNPMLTLATICLPVALFVLANWCITTLMEGEGKMRDIYLAVCYSLMPMILGQIVLIALSNLLTLEEASVYSVVSYGLWLYTVFLLLAGNMQAHGFTMGRTLGAAVVTVFAMAVIVFLAYLFCNLLFEVAEFVSQVYREIVFRV